jgi:hypothetical protein
MVQTTSKLVGSVDEEKIRGLTGSHGTGLGALKSLLFAERTSCRHAARRRRASGSLS